MKSTKRNNKVRNDPFSKIERRKKSSRKRIPKLPDDLWERSDSERTRIIREYVSRRRHPFSFHMVHPFDGSKSAQKGSEPAKLFHDWVYDKLFKLNQKSSAKAKAWLAIQEFKGVDLYES